MKDKYIGHCVVCGKEFKHEKPMHGRRRMTCSEVCGAKRQACRLWMWRKNRDVTCNMCILRKRNAGKDEREIEKDCISCITIYSKRRLGQEKTICPVCGIEFETYNSVGVKRKYCSEKCRLVEKYKRSKVNSYYRLKEKLLSEKNEKGKHIRTK